MFQDLWNLLPREMVVIIGLNSFKKGVGPIYGRGRSTVSGCGLFAFLPGWDISSMNLADAMQRAQVLDWALQEQLRPHMAALKPRPSIYIPEFIAANQEARADHILMGTKAEQVGG